MFKWRDSESTVTITFNVPPSTKKGDLDIGFNSLAVRIALKGQSPLIEGQVYGPLVPAKCKASIKKDVVTVSLQKATPADWPSLLSPAALQSAREFFFFFFSFFKRFVVHRVYRTANFARPIQHINKHHHHDINNNTTSIINNTIINTDRIQHSRDSRPCVADA
jgi:hypothetical protein